MTWIVGFAGQIAEVRLILLPKGVLTAGSNISIAFGSAFNMQGAKIVGVLVQNNCSLTSFVASKCPTSNASFNSQFQKYLGNFNAVVSLQDKFSYVNATIVIVISNVQNPTQGGWAELVRAGGLKIILPNNVIIFNSSFSTLLSVDPRRSNLAAFAVQDIRGLPATASGVSLIIRISPMRNISINGSIELQIPKILFYDSATAIKVLPMDSNYMTATGLVVRSLLSSNNISILSIQYATKLGNSPLLIAGVNVSIQLSAFQTPNAQPPLVIGPFKLRTLSVANSSHYSLPWDSPDSWGYLSDIGRVMESSAECCLGVQLTDMGPISTLAAMSIQNPLAGAMSNITFEFVTSLNLPAPSYLQILMPANFQSCYSAQCSPGACTPVSCSSTCIDQVLQIFEIVSYDRKSALESSSAPSRVWRCGSSATEVLGPSCTAPLVDCGNSSIFVGSNAIAFATSRNINAGYRVVIKAGGIILPSQIAPIDPFKLTLQPAGSIGTIINPWTQAAVSSQVNLLASMIPAQNSFIAPQDKTVGLVTSYSIFVLTSTGLPIDGFIEVTFPTGTGFSSPKLLGASLSGAIAGTGNPLVDTLYLQPPASTSANLYGNSQIHLLPNQCAITVTKGDASDIISRKVVWTNLYSGWYDWFFSSLCFKVAGAMAATVTSPYLQTLPPQKIFISSSRSIDTSGFGWFAISNLKPGIPVNVVGNYTIRISGPSCGQSCFGFPIPPRGILNLTVGGVMNAPIPKISAGSFTVKLFSADGVLLESGANIPAATLSPRTVSAELLLERTGAHDLTSCILIVSIDSQIQAGSTIEVKFTNPPTDDSDPRAGFNGANNLIQIESLNLSSTSDGILSRSFLLNPATIKNLYPVNVSILSGDSRNCYWNQSKITTDPAFALKLCQSSFSSTAKILVSTLVPANSIIGLRLLGGLRTPARPGAYSWPLDAVKIFQWDPVVPDELKTKTADATELYSPARLSLITNGLASALVNITGGKVIQPSTWLSNPYAGNTTSIKFSFVTGSGIFSSDRIFLFVPRIFSASATSTQEISALSVIGYSEGLPGALAVKAISQLDITPSGAMLIEMSHTISQQDCTALSISSGIDQPISFVLGPFQTRDYATLNFQGKQEQGYGFGMFIIDIYNQVVESSEYKVSTLPTNWTGFVGSFPSAILNPKRLNLSIATSSSRSGAISNISVAFTTMDFFSSATELFLFLPIGFSLAGVAQFFLIQSSRNSSSSILLSTGPVQRETIVNGRFVDSIVLRVRFSTAIYAGIGLTVIFSNIVNPMGGPSQSLPLFTLATSDACASSSAASCYLLSSSAIAPGPRIKPGALRNSWIKFSSTAAGNLVMSEFRFVTTNPFPALGSIEIRLPFGYKARSDLQYCSTLVTTDNICPLPCTLNQSNLCPVNLELNSSSIQVAGDGSTVRIKSWNSEALSAVSPVGIFPNFTFVLNRLFYPDDLHMPGMIGVQLAFNLSSLKLRQSSGHPGYFNIRILDMFGNIIDETDEQGIVPKSGPILPNRLLMTLVQPLSLAASDSGPNVIQFTPFNPVPNLGRICVTFPSGFNISRSELAPFQTIEFLISGIQGQEICIIDTFGREANSFTRVILASVKNPPLIGPTGEFQIKTADAQGNIIDQDFRVLFQNLVPALLLDSEVMPLYPRAGANSDFLIAFTSPISNARYISLSFPTGYYFNGATSIPIKSINVDNVTLCSPDSQLCANATSHSLPYPSLRLLGFFPVSGYSDQYQIISVFGSDFDKYPDVIAKYGSATVPSTVISSNLIEIQINCDIYTSQRPKFCDFVDTEASIIRNTCKVSTNSTLCSPSICSNNSREAISCFDVPVKIDAQLSLSVDGSLFVSSKTRFSLHRKIGDGCPNNCWASAGQGICISNMCSCKYPYGGIDCGFGPLPLSVAPNFGPSSGDKNLQFFYGWSLHSGCVSRWNGDSHQSSVTGTTLRIRKALQVYF